MVAIRGIVLRCGRLPSWLPPKLVLVCLLLLSGFAGLQYSWLRLAHGSRGSGELVPARIAATGNRVGHIVPCREKPIAIRPAMSMKHLVGDEEFSIALVSALPRWAPPTVSALIHELKCWGPDFVFSRDTGVQGRSGAFVVRTLLNDEHCVANTVTGPGHLLLDSAYGIQVMAMDTEGALAGRAEGHYGQLLKALAQAGVPSSTPVTSASQRNGTVADIFQDAVLRFSYGEELEFIACALALWLPQHTWTNQFGDEFSFDELTSTLLQAPRGRGPCGGCHLPYSIVVILRVDETESLLSEEVRRDALGWLNDTVELLRVRQIPSGGWDRSWSGTLDIGPIMGLDLLDRVTVTGHHLEWMALAPREIRCQEGMLRTAVRSLASDLAELTSRARPSFKDELPASHAARALALMRNESPSRAFAEYQANGRIKGHVLQECSPMNP